MTTKARDENWQCKCIEEKDGEYRMAFYNEFGKYSGNIALIDASGKSMTYKELECITDEIGNIMKPRTLVFILCSNTMGAVAGYVACLKNSVVPLLLKVDMEERLRINLMDIYQPSCLFVPDNMKGIFPVYDILWEGLGYCLIRTGYVQEINLHSDLALLLTTSGSTGSPKLVRQSYDNIQANAESIAEYLGITEDERPVTTLPMNYTYGLSIINSHFLVGATILLTEKGIMQKDFWNFFMQQDATSFGGVPYTYEMLDRLHFYHMELPSLRYMTQAGGKLLPKLHKKFAEYAKERGKKFIVMYGQCEATARMGYLPADKALEKCGSMGIAIPGGHFRLIDVNGQNITEPYVTGELVYEGSNVTLGYAECREDLMKGDERFNILQTGDMAQFDTDGYYYIVGRKKRFLKIYGNRVNLDEIERMIKSKFQNTECASSGIDDHMYIFITNLAIAGEVKQYVVSKTGLNAAAFNMIAIDDIPKNDAGKILYRELEKYYV